jgi:hypothetical protein
MRNLKRVLSLVMMIAMLAGLMVVGAGAAYNDFTDKDEIQNKTAVQTLVELNVIAGKEDGSYYDPQGLLTRAEAAKLVCVVLNGGKDPILSDPDYVSYKDTKDNWASAYIEYVTTRKIVAGDGQGNFMPNETVTAAQLAKMLLVAIGYDAAYEGLVGNSWNSKADALANENGLYDNLSGLVTSDPLNRDNAAQIIYNVLTAHLVRYKSAADGVGVVADPQDETVLSRFFNTNTVVGVILANDVFTLQGGRGSSAAAKNKVKVSVRHINDIATDAGTMLTLPVGATNDLVGLEVAIFVKNMGKTTESVIGAPIPTENNKVVSTRESLTSRDKAEDFLDNNGIELGFGYRSATYVENGVVDGWANMTDLYDSDRGYAGMERRLVDNNGDGKAEYLFFTWEYLEQVTGYSAKNETITFSDYGTYDLDKVVAYDGIAKDDYVLLYEFGARRIMYVEEATNITGAATAYNTANEKLTVNKKTYIPSAVGNYTYDLADYAPGTYLVGVTKVFYLDKAGNIVAMDDPAEAAASYALVLASNADVDILGTPSGTVKMTLTNGTTKTYTVNLLASANKYIKADPGVFDDTIVDEDSSNSEKEMAMARYLANGKDGVNNSTGAPEKNPFADAMRYFIVSYIVNDDGTVTIAPTQADGEDQIPDGAELATRTNTSYEQDGNTILATNSTTYFFVDEEGVVTVVNGINALPTSDDGAGSVKEVAYTASKDGSKFTAQAALVLDAEGIEEEGASSFVYLLGDQTYTKVNGEDRYIYSYVTADGEGKIETATSKDGTATEGLYKMTEQGSLVKLTPDDMMGADDLMLSYLEIKQISSDGTMLMYDGTELNVASGVGVVDISDLDSPAAASVSDLSVNNRLFVVLNKAGLAVGIFVDTTSYA